MLFKYVLFVVGLALTVSTMSSNTAINTQNMKTIFEAVKPYSDLSNAFYSIKGLALLGDKLDAQNAKEVCEFAKAKVDSTKLESIFQASSLVSLIPGCSLDTAAFKTAMTKGETSKNVAELYYFVSASENLKMKFDSKKMAKTLTDALKADSSIVNQGYSLHIASVLAENNQVFYDSIEDILDQADEVDKTSLQYEGGVGTTSIVLEGIYALAEKFKAFPAKLTNERLGKFVNYLSSKRYVSTLKGAYFLLRAADKLSNNKFAVPLILNRMSSAMVNKESSNLLVSVTTILGGAIKDAQINLDALKAVTSEGKSSLFAAKKPFTIKSSDGTSFEVKLVDGDAQPGFYTVTVGLNGDKRLFLAKNSVKVKVTTKVNIADLYMGVFERDNTNPQLKKYDSKTMNLDADQQSKFKVRFALKDATKNSLIEAHQVFVKFTEVASGREIIYLAETGLSKTYDVEIDFSTNGKNFRYQSGAYNVDLIVSDALFENPTMLKLSSMKIKFTDKQLNGLDKTSMYKKKDEIKHMFRKPEKTPPKSISTVFAVLCLVPFCLVIFLWMKIGFNFNKFQVTLPAIVFHLSLAGIFGLFYCYWIKINMFVTIKYLAGIGLVTLISGNKLLKSLAAYKEKSN